MNTYYKYINAYFLLISLIFATASSYYLSGGTANVGIFPELYYFKHGSLFLLALIGFILFILKEKKKVNILFILIIPYLIYLGINFGIVFFQFLSFIIATILLSYAYNSKIFVNKTTILVYFIISISIPLIDFLLNNGNFIFNSFYGRERLLLGYFHPKEAGIMFLVFFMMIILSGKLTNYFQRLFFYTFSLSFLYFVQSRNALLFLLNFIVLNFLIRKIGLKITLLIYISIYIIIPSLILFVYFEELNLLMSNRLSVWLSGFEFNLFGRFLEFSTGSNQDLFKYKFHIDNFYLEFLIEAGFIPFIILLICLIYLGYKIRKTILNDFYMISFYISFLIFCIFDSGMFSTGNFLNIFAWSIVVFLIREKRNLIANNLR